MVTALEGRFIAVEGIDGAGKTTLSEGLAKAASRKYGNNTLVNSERPDESSKIGLAIRSALRETPLDQRRVQQLFSEYRRARISDVVLPHLARGYFVVNDRYRLGTIAYGGSQGVDRDWLENLNADLPVPDHTFLLTVNPAIAVQRTDKRGLEKSPFETQEKLRHIQEEFLKIIEERRRLLRGLSVIDGSQSIEKVLSDSVSAIAGMLE